MSELLINIGMTSSYSQHTVINVDATPADHFAVLCPLPAQFTHQIHSSTAVSQSLLVGLAMSYAYCFRFQSKQTSNEQSDMPT